MNKKRLFSSVLCGAMLLTVVQPALLAVDDANDADWMATFLGASVSLFIRTALTRASNNVSYAYDSVRTHLNQASYAELGLLALGITGFTFCVVASWAKDKAKAEEAQPKKDRNGNIIPSQEARDFAQTFGSDIADAVANHLAPETEEEEHVRLGMEHMQRAQEAARRRANGEQPQNQSANNNRRQNNRQTNNQQRNAQTSFFGKLFSWVFPTSAN